MQTPHIIDCSIKHIHNTFNETRMHANSIVVDWLSIAFEVGSVVSRQIASVRDEVILTYSDNQTLSSRCLALGRRRRRGRCLQWRQYYCVVVVDWQGEAKWGTTDSCVKAPLWINRTLAMAVMAKSPDKYELLIRLLWETQQLHNG